MIDNPNIQISKYQYQRDHLVGQLTMTNQEFMTQITKNTNQQHCYTFVWNYSWLQFWLWVIWFYVDNMFWNVGDLKLRTIYVKNIKNHKSKLSMTCNIKDYLHITFTFFRGSMFCAVLLKENLFQLRDQNTQLLFKNRGSLCEGTRSSLNM